MKITVIGWYGTETIGDRAILAGLFSFFKKAFDDFEIKLGSLYPFFSERTINEDYLFWKSIIKKDIKVDLFDSKNSKKLDSSIKDSDIIVMGGGPLMDIEPMYMIEYGFKKAKKLNKKTALLGCGIGPLFNKKYEKCLINIINNADLIILRDSISRKKVEDIYNRFNKKCENENIFVSFDPAIQCCKDYIILNNERKDLTKYIAVNLRKYPKEYGISTHKGDSYKINNLLKKFIENIATKFDKMEIKLIPMHYFHVGNDDREFLNNIKFDLNLSNINVQNKNLNLYETMQIYQNAKFNIGMRYHSVILQTMLNGRNFILDYTEPKQGKIFGFINDIDKYGFYEKRYIYLQKVNKINFDFINVENVNDKFEIDNDVINRKMDIYIKKIKELI